MAELLYFTVHVQNRYIGLNKRVMCTNLVCVRVPKSFCPQTHQSRRIQKRRDDWVCGQKTWAVLSPKTGPIPAQVPISINFSLSLHALLGCDGKGTKNEIVTNNREKDQEIRSNTKCEEDVKRDMNQDTVITTNTNMHQDLNSSPIPLKNRKKSKIRKTLSNMNIPKSFLRGNE